MLSSFPFTRFSGSLTIVILFSPFLLEASLVSVDYFSYFIYFIEIIFAFILFFTKILFLGYFFILHSFFSFYSLIFSTYSWITWYKLSLSIALAIFQKFWLVVLKLSLFSIVICEYYQPILASPYFYCFAFPGDILIHLNIPKFLLFYHP